MHWLDRGLALPDQREKAPQIERYSDEYNVNKHVSYNLQHNVQTSAKILSVNSLYRLSLDSCSNSIMAGRILVAAFDLR